VGQRAGLAWWLGRASWLLLARRLGLASSRLGLACGLGLGSWLGLGSRLGLAYRLGLGSWLGLDLALGWPSGDRIAPTRTKLTMLDYWPRSQPDDFAE
jgi:hypothetical protein